jgi:hypothetical protein
MLEAILEIAAIFVGGITAVTVAALKYTSDIDRREQDAIQDDIEYEREKEKTATRQAIKEKEKAEQEKRDVEKKIEADRKRNERMAAGVMRSVSPFQLVVNGTPCAKCGCETNGGKGLGLTCPAVCPEDQGCPAQEHLHVYCNTCETDYLMATAATVTSNVDATDGAYPSLETVKKMVERKVQEELGRHQVHYKKRSE